MNITDLSSLPSLTPEQEKELCDLGDLAWEHDMQKGNVQKDLWRVISVRLAFENTDRERRFITSHWFSSEDMAWQYAKYILSGRGDVLSVIKYTAV